MTSSISQQDLDALARAEVRLEDAKARIRSPMLTGPKRQHYLPEFYLNGFRRGEFLAVYDRSEDTVRIQKPGNTAVQGHFYTLEDADGNKRYEIEAFLSDYEGKAKPGIDKLVNGGALSADERTDLAMFIALAATRTPDMVNSIQHLKGEMVKHTARMLYSDVDQVYESLRAEPEGKGLDDAELREQAKMMVEMAKSGDISVHTDRKWAVRRAIEMALSIAPLLPTRNWTVCHRIKESQSFITTDVPVCLWPGAQSAGSFYGVGFGSRDAFIGFPLHQSCVLMMTGEGGNLAHRGFSQSEVRHTNLALGETSQRFVIGRDEALVRSIVSQLRLNRKVWRPKFEAC